VRSAEGVGLLIAIVIEIVIVIVSLSSACNQTSFSRQDREERKEGHASATPFAGLRLFEKGFPCRGTSGFSTADIADERRWNSPENRLSAFAFFFVATPNGNHLGHKKHKKTQRQIVFFLLIEPHATNLQSSPFCGLS
jgi:hypothetical protein